MVTCRRSSKSLVLFLSLIMPRISQTELFLLQDRSSCFIPIADSRQNLHCYPQSLLSQARLFALTQLSDVSLYSSHALNSEHANSRPLTSRHLPVYLPLIKVILLTLVTCQSLTICKLPCPRMTRQLLGTVFSVSTSYFAGKHAPSTIKIFRS